MSNPQSEAGKGSKPRKGRDQSAYETGWDRIFGKRNGNDQDTKQETTEPFCSSGDEPQGGQTQRPETGS